MWDGQNENCLINCLSFFISDQSQKRFHSHAIMARAQYLLLALIALVSCQKFLKQVPFFSLAAPAFHALMPSPSKMQKWVL